MLAWKIGNRTLTTILSLGVRHPATIYKALINAGAGIRRERIRPTRQDSHGACHGVRSDESLSRACIACQHYAIDSNIYNLLSTHLWRSAGRQGPLQKFECALHAQMSGNRGKLCESRRENAPLYTRAIPKAPHAGSWRFRSDFVAVRGRRS